MLTTSKPMIQYQRLRSWTVASLLFQVFLLLILLPISFSMDEAFCAPTPFDCGKIINISYPFGSSSRPPNCSYPGFEIECASGIPQIEIGSHQYQVKGIDYHNQRLTVVDMDLVGKTCPRPLKNPTIEFHLFEYTSFDINLTLYYNCPLPIFYPQLLPLLCTPEDSSHPYAYLVLSSGSLHGVVALEYCDSGVILVHDVFANTLKANRLMFQDAIENGFTLGWMVDLGKCGMCTDSGGHCGYNASNPSEPICYCGGQPNYATCPKRSNHTGRRKIKIIIGVCAGVGSCILTCLLFLFCFCYRKRRLGAASTLLSRGMSSDPSSRSELGKEGLRLPTHVFSYEELEDATNNFDPSKELGDGGFGTVYHGKLQDGRSVAVKRLYENNYRRVEQFMNEIDILSRLCHPNLVTLYGCTSRHSRELLLVYEYVPNGTVADHLHGNRAKDGCLTWPIRMGIAIETADALSYLHAVDIIHRDVKTNNILLDNNFRVKVADFGLSRLFPMDKTHVSTAPQGTPGYVDPDYHRCYQLNDKSDVYSFGVVLIELISSKPAVDITRHRHEINLANMAINKIHNRALHEMVDPTLGYETDHAVMRMITLVSELAFRCLQDEKEVRPSMYEVLKVLKEIEKEDYNEKGAEMDLQAADDAVLLNKKMPPTSPDSVTNVWTSRSTTPNASG